jgi:hypothetical protein
MKYIKLFERFGSDSDFVVTENTTAADLKKALDKCFENWYAYGNGDKIVDLCQEILHNSIEAIGKDEEPEKTELYARFEVTSNEVMLDNEILFEYSTGHDSYGFEVTEYKDEDILQLLNVIKEYLVVVKKKTDKK